MVAISDNANSFGLSGHVLVARDGEGFEVGRCRLGDYPEPWTKGQDVAVPFDESADGLVDYRWGELSCETPRPLPRCPAKVLREVYPT